MPSYDEAFKAAAVARLKAGEYVPDVAKTEGINQAMLRRWAVSAHVKITRIPHDEHIRRMQAARGLGMLKSVIVPKLPKITNGAQKQSIRLGLALLGAMPDEEAIHCKDLAEKLGVDRKIVISRVLVAKEHKHIQNVKSLGRGFYQKTPKGKKYQMETLPPP